RRLKDLELERVTVNGESRSLTDDALQALLVELGGFSSFGDWILVLRYLVFYFEERRSLVWDPTAQRQILRVLFLPSPTGRDWVAREREILELDSAMRNLQAIVNRQDREIGKQEAKLESGDQVRAELAALETIQATDLPRLEVLNAELFERDAARQSSRLR